MENGKWKMENVKNYSISNFFHSSLITHRSPLKEVYGKGMDERR